MPRKKPEQLKEFDYKPLGDKPLRRTPVSVKLPPELDEYVRSQPNKNQWLIAAIAEKVAREKHLAECTAKSIGPHLVELCCGKGEDGDEQGKQWQQEKDETELRHKQ